MRVPEPVWFAEIVVIPAPANVIAPAPETSAATVTFFPSLSIVPPFEPTATASFAFDAMKAVLFSSAYRVPPWKLKLAAPAPLP